MTQLCMLSQADYPRTRNTGARTDRRLFQTKEKDGGGNPSLIQLCACVCVWRESYAKVIAFSTPSALTKRWFWGELRLRNFEGGTLDHPFRHFALSLVSLMRLDGCLLSCPVVTHFADCPCPSCPGEH